jgi:hypothetical protein
LRGEQLLANLVNGNRRCPSERRRVSRGFSQRDLVAHSGKLFPSAINTLRGCRFSAEFTMNELEIVENNGG